LGANYREGLRARSKSEYGAKLNIGLMEAEETLYWLELLEGASIVSGARLTSLKTEISELVAILLVTLIKKARKQTTTERKAERAPKHRLSRFPRLGDRQGSMARLAKVGLLF
jgi:hypothetical protein